MELSNPFDRSKHAAFLYLYQCLRCLNSSVIIILIIFVSLLSASCGKDPQITRYDYTNLPKATKYIIREARKRVISSVPAGRLSPHRRTLQFTSPFVIADVNRQINSISLLAFVANATL